MYEREDGKIKCTSYRPQDFYSSLFSHDFLFFNSNILWNYNNDYMTLLTPVLVLVVHVTRRPCHKAIFSRHDSIMKLIGNNKDSFVIQ